jgi:hypothetical protein
VEVAVAVATTDLGDMVPAHHTGRIAFQAVGIGDAQLPGEVGHDARGDLGGVGEESTQEPHRTELHGESEAGVIAPASGDQGAIRVVEVEVAFEQGARRLARVAAVAPLLILGQEVDGHSQTLPQIAFTPQCRVPNRITMPVASSDTVNHRLP